jgi:hypothetical protein
MAIQLPIITIANKKINAKGTSINATNVADAKNSRICSNSFKVFANAPTDPFFDLYYYEDSYLFLIAIIEDSLFFIANYFVPLMII